MTDKFINIHIKSSGAKKNVDDLDGSMKKLGRDTDKVTRSSKKLESQTKKTSKAMLKLSDVAKGVATALVTRQVITYADAFSSAQNQIRQTTKSTEELTVKVLFTRKKV